MTSSKVEAQRQPQPYEQSYPYQQHINKPIINGDAEFKRFNLFLKKLEILSLPNTKVRNRPKSQQSDNSEQDLETEQDGEGNQLLVKLEHHGFADFLRYKLGHLQASPFEFTPSTLIPVSSLHPHDQDHQPSNTDKDGEEEKKQIYTQIEDYKTNTKYYIDPMIPLHENLQQNSIIVDDQGKSLPLSSNQLSQLFNFHQTSPNRTFPDFQLTSTDLSSAFHSLRKEIETVIISRITKATGYKWCYSKASYRDKLYLLEFNCFQDQDTDMLPSKFDDRLSPNRLWIEHHRQGSFAGFVKCRSSVNVGIQVFTRQFIVTYKHQEGKHGRLVDLVYECLKEFV